MFFSSCISFNCFSFSFFSSCIFNDSSFLFISSNFFCSSKFFISSSSFFWASSNCFFSFSIFSISSLLILLLTLLLFVLLSLLFCLMESFFSSSFLSSDSIVFILFLLLFLLLILLRFSSVLISVSLLISLISDKFLLLSFGFSINFKLVRSEVLLSSLKDFLILFIDSGLGILFNWFSLRGSRVSGRSGTVIEFLNFFILWNLLVWVSVLYSSNSKRLSCLSNILGSWVINLFSLLKQVNFSVLKMLVLFSFNVSGLSIRGNVEDFLISFSVFFSFLRCFSWEFIDDEIWLFFMNFSRSISAIF